ncbi:MAG: alpha-L-rhamnosidase, partial [Clostridia bacterium]|nr:alpha-L-rhamnosidase [Clostridia bacterium]
NDIYNKHLRNEDEFWTPFPFPSMAKADKTFKQNAAGNSWGFYSQALTVLRCTRWMDYYNKNEDFDEILEKWIKQWTFTDKLKFGQELHPLTGEPSECSEWYSSCMLVCLYAIRRLLPNL